MTYRDVTAPAAAAVTRGPTVVVLFFIVMGF